MNLNLKTIYEAIDQSQVVFLCTGNEPQSIDNKKDYRSLVRSIHSYIESKNIHVYLGKGERNPKWYGSGHFSHHLSPRVGRINEAKRHAIINNKFVGLPNESVFKFTKYLRQ